MAAPRSDRTDAARVWHSVRRAARGALGFGCGGTAVELFGDRVFRILPLTEDDAHDMVRSTRGAPLLTGYRGAPACDVAALEDVLFRGARLADRAPPATTPRTT